MMSSVGILKKLDIFCTASPDLFIKVIGLARMIFSFSKIPWVISALNFCSSLNGGSSSLCWISSTTRKPMLCRVNVYSAPGFPSPTMSFITF